MKVAQAVALLATATTCYSQTLELTTELEVRSGKDASAFIRGLSEDGPQGLVLQEENLFVSATGVAKDAAGLYYPEGTLITWVVACSDRIYEQELAEVGEKGVVQFTTAFGIEEDVDWVRVSARGDNTITLLAALANGTSESVAAFKFETSVYTISSFESVIPLIMLIVLSVLSRNVYIAMFFGIWIGSLVIEGGDIVTSFKELFDRHLLPSVSDSYNFRTITFTLFLAGFISMMKRSGGQEGFSQLIARLATTPKSTQLAAVAGGVGLFFDDYSSALILGSAFKGLTDRFHISREKLAFVVDSTSAPIASIAPISSWIAFELSRIKPELDNIRATSQFQEAAQTLPTEYTFFLNTIPTRYYPWFMLIIQIVLIASAVEFGPMLYAERKTRLGKRTDGGDGATDIAIEQDITCPDPDTPKRAYNFFVPLGFFIISLLVSLVNIGKTNLYAHNDEYENDQIETNARNVFGNSDSFFALIYTTMGASLFCLVFYVVQTKKDGQMVRPNFASLVDRFDCRLKNAEDMAGDEVALVKEEKDQQTIGKARPLMYFTEGVNTWIEGFKQLVPAILVLCLAFTIKSIVKGCATDRFFTNIILNGNLSAEALPTIIFFVASLLSFCTGTSWGTMSIMFPLVSFATFEKSEGDVELFTLAMSSILAGAIFGDHSSIISDTTILSSIGSGCSIGSHVYTQLPYALWGALFSMVVGTLPAGAGASPTGMLFIGGIILTVMTIVVSAPIVSKSGRLDVFSEVYLKFTRSHHLVEFKKQTVVFAAENPNLVDPEPSEWFGLLFKRKGPAAEVVQVADAKVEEGAGPTNPMDI